MSPDKSFFEVRRARPTDAGVVGRLLFDFNNEFDVHTPSAQELTRRFATLLLRDDVVVILSGEPAGKATGFAFLTVRPTPYYDGTLAQLEELYVVPALRDRRIGTALLERSIADVRALSAQEMHINVDEIDTDTRRFYERHGFVNVEPGADHRMLCYIRAF